MLELTACLSLVCPADRGDSGERQTCAETELGWQRDEYREGDLRWEIDSGKDFVSRELFWNRVNWYQTLLL